MKNTTFFFQIPSLFFLVVGAAFGQGLNGPTNPNGAATVSGSVVRDTGTTISGALVSLNSIPTTNPPSADFQLVTKSVSASSNGTFSVAGLPDGTYRLCAQVPRSSGLLDPCLWTATPPTVTITGGQSVQGQTITMMTGRLLQLQIQDTSGLIVQNEGKTPGAGLILAIGGPVNILTPFFIDGTTASGRSASVVIPYNTALKLVVHSSFYQIADAGGNAVPTSYSVPLMVAPTDAATPIIIQITGLQQASSTMPAAGVRAK